MSKTIYECFWAVTERYPERTALMYKKDKKYNALTFLELNEMVNEIAAGLQSRGISKGDRVAIFSYNRPEWVISDLAILKLGGIVVPIYHTLPPASVKYIINDAAVKLIFVETPELMKVINHIQRETPALQSIVAFYPITTKVSISFCCFQKLREKQERVETVPTLPDDFATIVYTSGTTGEPKGVMPTHRNIVSNALVAIKRFKVDPDDVFVSFLPLCHMFERTAGYYTILFAGGSIAYAENLQTILQDVQTIRPTVLITVPRVLEKAYYTVAEKVENGSPLKRKIVISVVRTFNNYNLFKNRKRRIPLSLKLRHYIYGKLVVSKFHQLTGGRLHLIVSGGAPLDKQIGCLFRNLEFKIVEGYGLTETSPIVSVDTLENDRLGTVGKPLQGIEVKISENDEILVRGPNVMKGYLNKPEETAKVIDEDGWFHTGDQGRFDDLGNLVISGRIKELIVTSYGKNIAPVPIEFEIAKSPYVEQVMLYGDQKPYLTALIVPQKEMVENYARTHCMNFSTYDELLKKVEIKTLINEEVAKAAVNFAPFEQIKAFTLISESFSIEDGTLTPTLKLRRNKIAEKFRQQIEAMYKLPTTG
ncbi:MAG: AMP-dependent synthetase/ligase [Candidatus Hodarchaeota archaeon]